MIKTKNHFDQVNSIYHFVFNRYRANENKINKNYNKMVKSKTPNKLNFKSPTKNKNLSLSPAKSLFKTNSGILTKISYCKPIELRKEKSIIEEFTLNTKQCASKVSNNLNQNNNKTDYLDDKCYFYIKLRYIK